VGERLVGKHSRSGKWSILQQSLIFLVVKLGTKRMTHLNSNLLKTLYFFFIAKGYEMLFFVKSSWHWILVMSKDVKIYFPIQKQLVRGHIFNVLAKTMKTPILPTLGDCATTTITFDLYMSMTSFDMFALVVNFIGEDWVSKHVIVGLFKTLNTTRVA
jgi:hypothetical protein